MKSHQVNIILADFNHLEPLCCCRRCSSTTFLLLLLQPLRTAARRGALCGDGLRFVLNGGRPHCALVKGAPNQVGPPKAILIIAPSKKEEQSMQASLLLLLNTMTEI